MGKKVIVGMSGGVDSSVAAALLVEKGYDVTGVIMKIWDESIMMGQTGKHACFGPDEKEDVEKAKEVCSALGIDLIEIDLKDEYKHTVLDYFASEYACGRTPNPCVRCNSKMKFGSMVDKVRELGIEFDAFATGHYVRVGFHPEFGGTVLMTAGVKKKDQSYFLYRLSRDQIEHVMFPLGSMTKDEVRTVAMEKNLGFEDVPESQDFIGGEYTSLLESKGPGEIVDTEGGVLGEHNGIEQYTVGQRRGLGIAAGKPLYVVRIDAENNQVVVGFDDELYKEKLSAEDVNWLLPRMPERDEFPIRCEAKIRSQQAAFPASVDALENGKLTISFAQPQRAVAPGQSVVLYQGDVVLGGGVIVS
jgi:tRNA-specific 2-thiouridylase